MGRSEGARAALGLVLSFMIGCASGSGGQDDVATFGQLSSGSTTTDGGNADGDTDAEETTGSTGGPLGGSTSGGDGEGETGGSDETGGAPQGLHACGDGVVDPGETCDLGPGNGPDSDCTPECQQAACGDGYVHASEGCDDGNAVDTDPCTSACEVAVCGDGIVHAGVEQCDDGNQADGDGCTAVCGPASCGDGVVQAPEACDDGNASNTDGCLTTCLYASCGDGHVQAGSEECDDGNGSNHDACLSTCVQATCGDGYVRDGVEECDGGGDPEVYSCSASCEDQLVWYYWTFESGYLPNPQACADFNAWRNAVADDHTSIRLGGTFDESGRFCNGLPATTLCNALRNGTSTTVQCDGHTWRVGTGCAGSMEVTVDGSSCECTYPGYALRPCVNLVDWGGVDTNTCAAPTQQIYIECGFD